MHDLVIRGASVVDGTGAATRAGDVAVDGDRIAQVGGKAGPGRREIAADGLLLTPGWVDIHTHYDGQATWDPEMTPSSWHGVTTAVFGNCGVGFAPVRPGAEKYLINLMEGVEDIPEIVLAEGIEFRWESFDDYMTALAGTPRVMDIGAQVPHGALRFYAMGERGADHAQAPTDDEIARMGLLLEEALKAGALGFTTSRTVKHRARDGRPTPGLSAGNPELTGLARAMRRAGAGVLEVNSDFGDGDFERLRAMAEIGGRPLSLLLVQINHDPDQWRRILDGVARANAEGVVAKAQVGCKPIGIMLGLETSIHPFALHPLWRELADMKPAARVARLKADGALRRRLVEAPPEKLPVPLGADLMERTYALGYPIDYEPAPDRTLAARARAEGTSPWALALEAMLAQDGKGLLMHAFENYTAGSLDVVREMLSHEHTVCGVADAGAHVGLICDAGAPTFLLSHWARDRSRGDKLPLEFLVKKHTRDTAAHYGLLDRGVIAPGFRADLNLIDFAALRLRRPEVVYDLPAGGKRLVQKADGYRHTFVAGVETLREGEFTGERPGRFLRGARSAP
jgi:N-acyl-D-amino-acid deacylase